MTANELYKMTIDRNYKKVLEELEKLPPAMMVEFAEEFKKHGQNANDDFVDLLDNEEYKLFKYLESSERKRNYLASISDKEMTEQEWADLKATDF